mmetsp:Transcript_105929/g.297853  ORF Transcript_105929/g.297853 Transcript_105929/m.297853 type:complete len:241 (+) Transcript_105929:50-772(+)
MLQWSEDSRYEQECVIGASTSSLDHVSTEPMLPCKAHGGNTFFQALHKEVTKAATCSPVPGTTGHGRREHSSWRKNLSGVQNGSLRWYANLKSESLKSSLMPPPEGRPAASPTKKLLDISGLTPSFRWLPKWSHIPVRGFLKLSLPVATRKRMGRSKAACTASIFCRKASTSVVPFPIPLWFVKNTSLYPTLASSRNLGGTASCHHFQSSAVSAKILPDRVVMIVSSISKLASALTHGLP